MCPSTHEYLPAAIVPGLMTVRHPGKPRIVPSPVLDRYGRLLVAALGFARLPGPSYDRALRALRIWLDSWSGIGHVAVGMHRQGFDLQLTQYDERGWRATFCATGMEHSPTSATDTGWEPTPWHTTAWEALNERAEATR